MTIKPVTKNEFISFIENEAQIRIDRFIESAIELAEEAHSEVKREDGTSPFLETHIWPVTIDVVNHYKLKNKPITSLQIVSTILHDVMEDDEKILDLYASKTYGFDAYFLHRFGDYVYKTVMTLKVKPLENYSGSTDEEQKSKRFLEYCSILANSDYDVKTIKLVDRLNNMKFIAQIPGHEKIKRYIQEAEDFYIAFPMLIPQMDDFYKKIRITYDDLRKIKISA